MSSEPDDVHSRPGHIDAHHPAKRFRPAVFDDDDGDRSHDASHDTATSSVTTQESSGASSPSEVESDVYNPSNGSAPSTCSDQEESNSPLYGGSSISTKNFNAMLFALKQKHNLSSQAVDSVLKLIKSCLPGENRWPASSYQFEKSLLQVGFHFRKHVTCWKCQYPLEDEMCPNGQCVNAGMQAKGEMSSTFYIIDLFPEIERLISGVYHDIMDGKVYQEHSTIIKERGYLPITLYWHLDGAPALKSKNMSLWPIQSFVAELPLNLHYSYKNILLFGLWYGKKKPNMQVFQERFVAQVSSLSDTFQVRGQIAPS